MVTEPNLRVHAGNQIVTCVLEIDLGGHRDRHWHIGEGSIGFEGFRALLAHPELRNKTAILETPGTDEDDLRNMQTILAIVQGISLAG